MPTRHIGGGFVVQRDQNLEGVRPSDRRAYCAGWARQLVDALDPRVLGIEDGSVLSFEG